MLVLAVAVAVAEAVLVLAVTSAVRRRMRRSLLYVLRDNFVLEGGHATVATTLVLAGAESALAPAVALTEAATTTSQCASSRQWLQRFCALLDRNLVLQLFRSWGGKLPRVFSSTRIPKTKMFLS